MACIKNFRNGIMCALFLFTEVCWAEASALACSGDGLLSDFSAGNAASGFSATQEQDGSVGLRMDPTQPGNQVARMSAGPKGRQVGKAGLIHRFAPVGIGRTVDMSARFFVPEGEMTNSIILMDLECASCGLDTNPGVRLYLRDGRLRVDRSKIGIKEPFYPSVDHQVRPNQWHRIRWTVTLGDGPEGQSIVYLDGREVGRDRGATVLTQRVVSQIANIRVKEQVDRFQIGLTANSNRRRTELLVDDVRFCAG